LSIEESYYVDEAMWPPRRDQIIEQELGGEAILYDSQMGVIHQLNRASPQAEGRGVKESVLRREFDQRLYGQRRSA